MNNEIVYPLENPHAQSIQEIESNFLTDVQKGLSTAEAETRTSRFGKNIYKAQKQKSILLMFFLQFKSPITYLLFLGAAISIFFKDFVEAMAIGAVILINALIGFFMELQARRSMNALKEMDIIKSKVVRDGTSEEILSENITPGDIVLLEAGDVVPGDGRLIESNLLQCDESSLTGESLPTIKHIEVLDHSAALGDQFNMIFKGSSVMNGNGKAIITGIGMHTQLGAITSLVDGAEVGTTPLDKKLNGLTKKLIWITLITTTIFAITGLIQGKGWKLILETSIALAIAAVPEGLSIVATIALAYGMLLMAKHNAIVKSLSSVETLGSTNVILTDKTGTLTENKIYVETFSFPEEKVKVGIENNVLIFKDGQLQKSQENFKKLLLIGELCNNASLSKEGDSKKDSGDPVEIALLQLRNASPTSNVEAQKTHVREAEAPFSSESKIMGTLHLVQNESFASAKGSVEHLLEICTKIQLGLSIAEMTKEKKDGVIAESEAMAGEGLRVLAFAFKQGRETTKDNYLQQMIFVGLIGFLDPPRMDIKAAITQCRKAGIKVVMITGDHPLTALNIAKKVGLVDEQEKNFITGKDMPENNMLTDEWRNKILATAVFARTTPKQKLDIADIFQKAGNIVTMTGDGINDAPALKKADVGIAMGLRGTQVAKETASIILKDDSFTSIAKAVAYGRGIYQNIQKFVIYLVSCNISEIFVVTTLGFIAPASTLLPLQILFLNMVTDIFPALALGVGKGDETVMDNPPRDPSSDIVSNKNWLEISIYSALMTISVISAELYCKFVLHVSEQIGNNVAFLTLAFSQLFHVFNMASPNSKLLVNDITKNKFIWLAIIICAGLLVLVFVVPPMQLVLGLTNLSISIWLICILFSLLPLVLIQIYKIIWSKKISK